MTQDSPLQRLDLQVLPDPARVAARVFLPGQEPGSSGESRAGGVVARCLALGDAEVSAALISVEQHFGTRHRDLDRVLGDNFAALAHRVPAGDLTADRRRLLGAYFTREVAVESAALFNPSVVAHPTTSSRADSLRFVMSARAVGEGHLSTLVFRSGTFTPGAGPRAVVLDPPSRLVDCGDVHGATVPADRVRQQVLDAGVSAETLDFVLSRLPAAVDAASLAAADDLLDPHSLTRTDLPAAVDVLRRTVQGSYVVRFPSGSPLAARTLFPVSQDESHGVEDARFVRISGSGVPDTYAATYTGYDGERVVSRRLDTDDFVTFSSTALTGRGAQGKGMALFPRQVGGRHLALSRWDRENNALASSADGYHWDDVDELQQPADRWDLVQLGNCGSPIETRAGWLVLTHGVGPMRSYSMSALLLDLDDPRQVVGRLDVPLLRPAPDERDGYVPNVVYSCGGLVVDDTLLLPYGCSDRTIRFAVVDLRQLLGRLTSA